MLRRGIAALVRSASYFLGSVLCASIAEAYDRFPGQLPAAALDAHGNLICTVHLVASEVRFDFDNEDRVTQSRDWQTIPVFPVFPLLPVGIPVRIGRKAS